MISMVENIANSLLHDLLFRETDCMTAIRRLGVVQIDPVMVVAPNHHLVLGCRVDGYTPSMLEAAIEQHQVIEVWAHQRSFVPMEDLPLYLPTAFAARQRGEAHYHLHQEEIKQILQTIEAKGPLSPAEFAESGRTLSFWGTQAKTTTHLLELLWHWGYITVAKRKGNNKYYDLLERVVPNSLLANRSLTEEIQLRRTAKYLDVVRITDRKDPELGFGRIPAPLRKKYIDSLIAQGEVKSIRTEKYEFISPADFQLDLPPVKIEPTLLPPLDNLLWYRQRLEALWNFYYRWEIYTPEAKRKVGPYGMPLVVDGKIMGQADVKADRAKQTLFLKAVSPSDGRTIYLESLEYAGQRLARSLQLEHVRMIESN